MFDSGHGLSLTSVLGTGIVLLAHALLVSSCAVPVAPTGGPVDKIPPVVKSISPARDAVGVKLDSRVVRFEFSEYMNESSFSQSFSLSPEPSIAPKITWRRRVATVVLPEDLAPNTTYVLTLDTRLRDANGVAYASANSFAFSTGSFVSRGKISGRVIRNMDGKPEKAVDVFAYPVTDSISSNKQLPLRSKYRTQTTDGGDFVFDYLTPGPYVVTAVRDGNNNRRADESEMGAIGDTLFVTAADQDVSYLTLYSFLLDTSPPETRRLRTLSNSRLAIRYSEAIHPPGMDGWIVRDSVTLVQRDVRQAYISPTDPREVIIETEPLPATRHQVITPSVPDSAGTISSIETLSFTPGLESDTSSTRFVGYFPEPSASADSVSVVRADQQFGIELSQFYPVERSDSVRVFDDAGNRVAFVTNTNNGRSFEIVVDSVSRSGRLRMDILGAAFGLKDSTYTHFFAPMNANDLGSLSGIATSTSPEATVIVEAYQARTGELSGRISPDSSGRFELKELTPGNYRLRIIEDRNGNGIWDHGLFDPLTEAESLNFTADTLSVRARWESAYPDTIRVGRRGQPENE